MSIETPRDAWKPTNDLRWSLGGKLQVKWWREVSSYNDFWKRSFWAPQYEWRDVPTQSVDEVPVFPYPAPETGASAETSGERS